MASRRKIGRNDPCPCGSQKKYKKCHGSGVVSKPSSIAPLLPADREGIFEAIRAGVASIRKTAARYGTADLVAWCKWPLAGIAEQFGNKLVSQYRQLVFLLSLMVETPEPSQPPDMNGERWGALCGKLNWLFLQYGALDMDRAATTDETQFAQSWLAKSTFLHYFNTGKLASDVQLRRWLTGTLTPFDSELMELCGLSATEAITLNDAIADDIVERDDDEFAERFQRFVGAANLTGAIVAAKCAFFRSDLDQFVTPDAVKSFWRLFVVCRGGLVPTTTYPTDPHHLERTPFVEIHDGAALFTVPGASFQAIASRLSFALLESEFRTKYLKRRDDFLELEVVRIFQKFFDGAGVQIFPDAHIDEFQNDLLIVDGETILIVEAKAGYMKEPLRDIDKSLVRLKQNFDRVIGKAHEQAARTRRRLLAGETLSFFTKQGEPLVVIDGSRVSKVWTICVTADDFGPLARDMSTTLDKAVDEVFPWAVMINDLENFLSAFTPLGIERADFYKFLSERPTLHGRVEFGDELEVAGYFMKHGTLRSLDNGPDRRTLVDARYSDIFDELYWNDALK